MEPFFVYILRCNDASYYIGHTDDLERRIAEHRAGIFQSHTSSRLPVQLVFSQEFESRESAFLIERKMKKWTRKKKEALIQGDFALLSLCAKKDFS